jgi:hypothetical protein
MVRTAIQLKALVRNMSKGDNAKALTIIRNWRGISSSDMASLWRKYQRKFDYAASIEWKDIIGNL